MWGSPQKFQMPPKILPLKIILETSYSMKSPLRNSASPYNIKYSIKYNKTLTGG